MKIKAIILSLCILGLFGLSGCNRPADSENNSIALQGSASISKDNETKNNEIEKEITISPEVKEAAEQALEISIKNCMWMQKNIRKNTFLMIWYFLKKVSMRLKINLLQMGIQLSTVMRYTQIILQIRKAYMIFGKRLFEIKKQNNG